jgi:hypothetical protein
VEPFVENEILRILVLGVITATAISFLADAARKKVVGVFEVLERIVFGVIRIVMWAPRSAGPPTGSAASRAAPSTASQAVRSARLRC